MSMRLLQKLLGLGDDAELAARFPRQMNIMANPNWESDIAMREFAAAAKERARQRLIQEAAERNTPLRTASLPYEQLQRRVASMRPYDKPSKLPLAIALLAGGALTIGGGLALSNRAAQRRRQQELEESLGGEVEEEEEALESFKSPAMMR